MKFSYLILAFISFLSFSAYSQGGIGDGSGCPPGYTEYYADNDGDGYGDPQNVVCLGGGQVGYTLNNGDCNDLNANINPATMWYRDADGDGAGNINDWRQQCVQPVGYVMNSSDCNDGDASTTSCSTPTAVPPSNQSFESGFSPWVQDTADDLDWTRTSGTTPSSGTGPTAASNGTYYIFTESSGNYAKTFNLISPLLDITSGLDFTFNYHMYGTAMGSLTLSVSTNGGSSWTQLWSASGNKGSNWLSHSVDLSAYVNSEIKLRFSGVTGSSYTSDMALDNFEFTAQAPPPCAVVLSDENYVLKRIYQEPQTASLTAPTKKQVIEEVTYFDGLGRAMQHVGIRQGAGPACEDVVTHIEYDQYGREIKKYLPHPDGNNIGTFRTSNVISNINSYYSSNYADDFTSTVINPFSEALLEASPLNRPLKQAAPGYDWRLGGGHEIEFDYRTNTLSEVKLYNVALNFSNGIYEPTLVLNGSYAAGELTKTITYDENNNSKAKAHSVEEFNDKQGKTVLKRTYIGTTVHDTYYVYDEYGNLTYVLPPKSEPQLAKPDSTQLNELCYQYKYDSRNRLVEKKIPGKGWEYIVYNRLDQPILTQDPNLRVQEKWLYTKYDAFGRAISTGLHNNSAINQATMQGVVDNYYLTYPTRKAWEEKTTSSTYDYYTNLSYPTSAYEVLTLNYYDNYTFNHVNLKLPAGTQIFNDHVEYTTKGLATGSRIKVLDQAKWITTVKHYNKEGRTIYTASYNDFLITTDKVKYQLDFTGNIEKTETDHKKGTNASIVALDEFSYDHMNRIVKHTQTLNGKTEVIAANIYDQLGQLISKGVGNIDGSNRLQDIAYSYNARGWLKTINDVSNTNKLFNFKIDYNQPSLGTALFNGNISRVDWRTNNTDSGLKNYMYYYDDLNRITSATAHSTSYSLSGITYDKNGNILSLTRKGAINSGASSFGSMDILAYGYNTTSNKLKTVDDSGNDTYGFKDGSSATIQYSYDLNGNLTSDANKGITAITYNHLNLPELVTIGGQTIDYTYDATGVKLKKEIPGKVTEYAGNFVYEKLGTGSNVLQFFNHPEGYVSYDGGQFNYVYNYVDHLGNVRLSYTDGDGNGSIDPATEIIQEKNYYPFGLTHQGYNTNGSPYGNDAAKRYGFGGKELQDETFSGNTLDWYDVSARNYDPALGRWMNVDPLAEDYYAWSPYNYTYNNPLNFIDPTGMGPTDWFENSETGELLWKNSQEESITDESGETWNNVGEELLTFDGENLTYYTQEKLDDGNLELKSETFEAVSGREQDGKFDYSEEAQATSFSGPLPEGDYSVNPSEIQWWTDQSFITRTAAFMKKGTWPGGLVSWGVARTWLNPQQVNVLDPKTGQNVIRDNFSIHGGMSAGSAGCIDLTGNDLPFFRALEKSKSSQIKLRVSY